METREAVNNQNFHFLDERQELLGAYSNVLLPIDKARTQYLGKAKSVWNENENFHGADHVMANYIFDNHLIKAEYESDARELIERLEREGYGHKKQVDALYSAVDRYKANHAPNAIWRVSYREVLRRVEKELRPYYILISVEFDTVDDLKGFLSNKEASTGVLSCYTKYKKKRDLIDKKMLLIQHDLEVYAVKKGTMNEPTIIGTRQQLSIPIDDDGELKVKFDELTQKWVLDFKFKTRLVNMVSAPRIIMEGHYSVKVQALFSKFDWYAGGKTPQQLKATMSSNRYRYSRWDSMDYSSYDQSLPGWFIKDAFNIIKSWFKFRNEFDESRYDVMVHDFIHKKLVVGKSGDLVQLHDGVESGSMFTQIIDSLCNYIMIAYFCYINDKEIGKDCVVNICGDDNIVFHNGWFSGVDYLNTIRKVFGVIGHPEKSDLGHTKEDDPHYLSRYWKTDGIYRPWKELLVKLIFHERYREYDEEVTPAIVFGAYYDCYDLGMLEGFNMRRYRLLNPSYSIGWISERAVREVGGFYSYNKLYEIRNKLCA